MTRAVAFLLTALLAATLGAAQDTSSSSGTAGGQNTTSNSTTSSSQSTTSSSTTSSSSSSSSEQNATIEGCLSGSALGDNSFKLTDKNGTVYSLTGNADQLKSHVGHEVSITGQKISGNAGTSGSAASGTSGQNDNSAGSGANTIQVTGVTMMLDHCKTGGTGAGASAADARLIPASLQSTATDPNQGTPAADQGATAPTATQDQNPSPAAGQSAASKANLPNTATLLPLLGLLGLGSLVAGFLVRR